MDATKEPTPGTLRAEVWLALYNAPDGLTDDELDAVLARGPSPIPPLVWRARRAELVAEGVVFSRGERDGKPVWHRLRRRDPAPEDPMPETDDNRPTVLLIDGKNLLYRSLMSRGGEPAEQEFPRRLRELRERYAPAFAIVTWDADGPTWRHNAYADYKAQRNEPSAYERQVYAQVPGWAAQCGYQFVEAPGWEADDIIGTYAKRLREAHRVVIVSNDKDLTQLLAPGVVMLKGWSEVITHNDVPKAPTDGGWGVPVERIPDLLAIMGDSSDNIPGVPKVGQVGAAKLIAQFGGIEDIIAAAKSGKDKAKARAERIVAHAEALRLFKRLTTVSCGIEGLAAPVPCSAMPPAAPGKREALDGMTILDGVLFPLPETAFMAKSNGYVWTNPTAMPARAQAQLRPGEPLERWEREDHWGYLIERGGQWTFVHRGIEGDIETGKADLGSAIAEARLYHVAYAAAALTVSYGAVNALSTPWEAANAPALIPLDIVAQALDHARGVIAQENAALTAQTEPEALRARRNVPNVAYPAAQTATAAELPNGTRLAIEADAAPGLTIGSIELPAGFAGSPEPVGIEVRVDIGSPTPQQAAPMLTAAQVAAIQGNVAIEPAGLAQLPPVTFTKEERSATEAMGHPPAPKAPVWRIPPAPDGKATIPSGYARVLAALAMEAFTGHPAVLVWDVDLKTDIDTPPLDDPASVAEFRDTRARHFVGRLHKAIEAHADDPGAMKPLGIYVHDPNADYPLVPVDLRAPNLVNIARIANGPPPIGRWLLVPEPEYQGAAPARSDERYFDPLPF